MISGLALKVLKGERLVIISRDETTLPRSTPRSSDTTLGKAGVDPDVAISRPRGNALHGTFQRGIESDQFLPAGH